MAGFLDAFDPVDGLLAETAPGLLGPWPSATLPHRMTLAAMPRPVDVVAGQFRAALAPPDLTPRPPEASGYQSSWRERIGAWLMDRKDIGQPGYQPSHARRDFVSGLIGSTGLPGTGSMGLVDLTPIGAVIGAQEGAREGDPQAVAMAMIPGARGAKGAVTRALPAPKAFAFGTYEATPGIGIGHLPKLAQGAEAERKAFAMDPRSTWEDPRGRDVIYELLGMRPRPTRPATGMYQTPGGPLEIGPANVTRPLVRLAGEPGQQSVDPPSRAMMNAAEAVRAYIDGQNAGGWSRPILTNNVEHMRSLFIPNKGPMTPEQMMRLKDIGAQHGLPDIVDSGGGVIMTNFHGNLPEANELAKSLKEVGLAQTIRDVVPDGVPRRAQLEAGHIPYNEEWRAGEGSGAVTRELRRYLQDPQVVAALDASPEMRSVALARLERDAEIAAQTNQPVRADLQRAREIIATEGFSGLLKALERGVALPAAVLAPLVGMASGERPE